MFGRSESYFRFPASHGVAPRVTPEDAPARIVEDGLIRLGMFRTPVRQMNLPESRLLRGLGASWPMPPLMLEWIGAGIAHPDWYLGLIVVDAKVGSLAVLYGFNRNTREYFSHDRPGLRRQVKVANSTWNERLEEVQPLVLLSPIEGGGFLYNHKVQMPTQGSLRIGNERVDFDPRRDLSNLDDLKIHVGGTRLHQSPHPWRARVSWNSRD